MSNKKHSTDIIPEDQWVAQLIEWRKESLARENQLDLEKERQVREKAEAEKNQQTSDNNLASDHKQGESQDAEALLTQAFEDWDYHELLALAKLVYMMTPIVEGDAEFLGKRSRGKVKVIDFLYELFESDANCEPFTEREPENSRDHVPKQVRMALDVIFPMFARFFYDETVEIKRDKTPKSLLERQNENFRQVFEVAITNPDFLKLFMVESAKLMKKYLLDQNGNLKKRITLEDKEMLWKEGRSRMSKLVEYFARMMYPDLFSIPQGPLSKQEEKSILEQLKNKYPHLYKDYDDLPEIRNVLLDEKKRVKFQRVFLVLKSVSKDRNAEKIIIKVVKLKEENEPQGDRPFKFLKELISQDTLDTEYAQKPDEIVSQAVNLLSCSRN